MRKEANINKKVLFEKLGYEPHSAAQNELHNNTARFRVPCCGRRWGKSISAGHEMTYYMFIPDSYYWIVGPTYNLAEKEFRVVYNDIARKLRGYIGPSKIRATYNAKQGDMRIEIKPWNTILECKSAEKPDSLVGEGLDGVIMSEAAKHKMSTWQMYIEPSLSDKLGWAMFPSTPQGYNWFKGLYDLGQNDDYTDYASWRLPSWTNPVRYPGGEENAEIKRLKHTTSQPFFMQEIAAEFTAFTGKIYQDFTLEDHVRRIEYNPLWRNFWFFDYGFTNPFVCLDVMMDPSDSVYVWREYQKSYVSTFEHGHYLKNRPNPDGFHIDGMFGDPRGADESATLHLMLGFVASQDVPWITGVEIIRRLLKHKQLVIDPSCTELIRQMDQLRAPEGKEGAQNATEGQLKYDDHGPDALRYGLGQIMEMGSGGDFADIVKGYNKTEAATMFQYGAGFGGMELARR